MVDRQERAPRRRRRPRGPPGGFVRRDVPLDIVVHRLEKRAHAAGGDEVLVHQDGPTARRRTRNGERLAAVFVHRVRVADLARSAGVTASGPTRAGSVRRKKTN